MLWPTLGSRTAKEQNRTASGGGAYIWCWWLSEERFRGSCWAAVVVASRRASRLPWTTAAADTLNTDTHTHSQTHPTALITFTMHRNRLLNKYNAPAHTHARAFNGASSVTTWVHEPVPERQNQSGFYCSKRQWVAVASAGPHASLHVAPDRWPRQLLTTQFYTSSSSSSSHLPCQNWTQNTEIKQCKIKVWKATREATAHWTGRLC